jgi:hypothetical protein
MSPRERPLTPTQAAMLAQAFVAAKRGEPLIIDYGWKKLHKAGGFRKRVSFGGAALKTAFSLVERGDLIERETALDACLNYRIEHHAFDLSLRAKNRFAVAEMARDDEA